MPKKNYKNLDIVKQRLLQYAENQDIGMMGFYKKISIAQSNFSGKGGESSLSTDKIIQILIEFPDLSPDWLLLGRGEMLRSGANAVVQGNSGNVRQGGVQSVVSGAGATVQQPSAQDVESLLAIISQKDIQIAEKDKQIGRLLALLEGGAR